jgi:hypothetical protein
MTVWGLNPGRTWFQIRASSDAAVELEEIPPRNVI